MTARKLTITMQPIIVKKLDRVRGVAKRSTYISNLIEEDHKKKTAKELEDEK